MAKYLSSRWLNFDIYLHKVFDHMETIKIFNITGVNAVSMQRGNSLYDAITEGVQLGKKYVLDFSGVEIVAAPFLNSSIGLLLRDITASKLTELVSIQNISTNSKNLINLVISNATAFYESNESVIHSIGLAEADANAFTTILGGSTECGEKCENK